MPTHIDSLAQVYARSLFELAEEAGGRDKILEIGDELEQICEVARRDRAFGEFIRSPILDRKARAASISRIFSDNITDLTLRFLLVLNRKGRLAHLERIAAGYDQLVQEAFGRIEVDIYTPQRLEPEHLERIKLRVQEALQREPVIYPYADPDMIGGIKLRIGDQLIDASVATRLRRMRDQLIGAGTTRLRDHIDRMSVDGDEGADRGGGR